MNFEEYSGQADSTAQYPLKGSNLVYPSIKLAGEAGETADKIGKNWRNRFTCVEDLAWSISSEAVGAPLKVEIIKELGDVLWYINAIALELGTTLETVAQVNIEKLRDRAERGTIKSSGDNR
jgi:NTP pyrophosphatase (non-canonical NTP hydrolase)